MFPKFCGTPKSIHSVQSLSRVQLWATPQMAAHQAYCHLVYLTYMQSTSREMLDWKKHKLESRLLGEISITSDMQMTPPLWQKATKN